MMFSDEDGRLAVRMARSTVEHHVSRTAQEKFDAPPLFRRKAGVFVTLTTHPGDDLRGCIGYPEPTMPLADAIKDSAISACARDPRFPPMTADELDEVKVEVSLLTPPEEIHVKKQTDLPTQVMVGTDGLIVQRGWARGLLLPQVPVEWGWDAEEFISQACCKAGLPPDSWVDKDTKVFKFQAEVFSEDRPRGEVRRRNLSEEHGSSH